MHSLRIFFSGIKVALASRMAYRGDFIIRLVVMLIGDLLFPVITLLIYRAGASFAGWTLSEALLIQGVFMIAKGLSFPFFYGMVYNILDKVREGTFDLILIRPCSVLFFSIVSSFNIEYIGSLFGGTVLLIYALLDIGTSLNILSWLNFLVLFAFSILILLSFTLIMSGTLFKWVGNSRVYEIFNAITTFCLYPKTIYSRAFQNLISYLIPIAMIAFYPAAALLGRIDYTVIYSMAISVMFFLFSRKFWYIMLKNYTSAGG